MEDVELAWLWEKAGACRLIAEVGVFKARSTVALCMGVQVIGTVFAVDHWRGNKDALDNAALPSEEQRREAYLSAMQQLWDFTTAGFCTPLAMPSVAAAKLLEPKYGGQFDMIFIDGDHSLESVREDIAAWLPLLRHDGLFCGHDWKTPVVQKGVTEAFPNVQRGPGNIWYR